MESRETLSPTSFLSAGRVFPFTDDISTRVEPGLSLPATSLATLSVLSMGTAITVTSHPFTASELVGNDANRPPLPGHVLSLPLRESDPLTVSPLSRK